MEDGLNNGDDLERMTQHEEMVWEVWLRVFMYDAMKCRDNPQNFLMYNEWLRKRAGRTKEDWYGTPRD